MRLKGNKQGKLARACHGRTREVETEETLVWGQLGPYRKILSQYTKDTKGKEEGGGKEREKRIGEKEGERKGDWTELGKKGRRKGRTAEAWEKEMLDRDTALASAGLRLESHLNYILFPLSLSFPPPALAPVAQSKHFRKSDEINKHHPLALRKLWENLFGIPVWVGQSHRFNYSPKWCGF